MNRAKWEPLKEPYSEMGFNTWEVQCSACGLPQDEPYQICPGCGSIMEGDYPMPPHDLNKSWWEIYYENRRHFICPDCQNYFTLSFWKWLFTPKVDFWKRIRLVKCPYCKKIKWIIPEKII